MTLKSAGEAFGLGGLAGQPGLGNRPWEQFDPAVSCCLSPGLVERSGQNGLRAYSSEEPGGQAPARDTRELAGCPGEMLQGVIRNRLSVTALTSSSFCCLSSCPVLAGPLRLCRGSSDTLDMPFVDFKSAQLLKLVQKAGLFWTKLNSTRCLKTLKPFCKWFEY